MYAADTEDAAIAETLLHDIPAEGGLLPYDQYATKVLVRLKLDQQPARRACCTAPGCDASRSPPAELTSSPASSYATTVRWAEAAHDAGLDGLVWMSRQCNDTKAYVFFGDRCAARVHPGPVARAHLRQPGRPNLADRPVRALHVDVLMEPS